jgi:hypothetical protein
MKYCGLMQGLKANAGKGYRQSVITGNKKLLVEQL